MAFVDTLKNLEENKFILKYGNLGGDEVVLVEGAYATFTKETLIYRSSIWRVSDGKLISPSCELPPPKGGGF
jgi:hypothetical protein